MRILIVEDDPRLGPSMKKGLEGNNYAVDLIADGENAYFAALNTNYDIIVLDVLLPRMNGFEICRQLRARKLTTPILILTALGEVDHRVRGLDIGADDYLTKPFAFRELEARVRALLRRESDHKTPTLQFADITLNTLTHEVRRGQRELKLYNKEYALLEFLLRHPRQVLSREMIAEHVWNNETDHLSNVIDVYIRYLRRKLCAQQEPDLIQTVRGTGYQLKEPGL